VKQTILAKRYAKALFAVGKEEDKFKEYGRTLQAMADLYTENPTVVDALTNPLYPLEVRSKVMAYLIGLLKADQIMTNFLNLLVEKKRADILPEIAVQFQAMVDAAGNICQGTVVTAAELSTELQGKVQAALEKITGKKVVLSTRKDPMIIGGMIAKVGDLVLDGSLKTQLMGLKEAIKGSE